MRLLRYSPDMFGLLKSITPSGSGLSHEAFVNYYYATRPECALHVLVDGRGAPVGTVGVERMPFEYDGRPHTFGFASNLFGAVPAAGGYLYLHWMKSAPIGMVFGGSADTHRILRAQHWTYYSGIGTYRLNWTYPVQEGESGRHRIVKAVLRRASKDLNWAERAASVCAASVSAREEREYRNEMIAMSSAFTLRLAPDLSYLRWRYALDIPFARYRVFTIYEGSALIGYVVIRDRSDHVIVAHADGTNPRLLAMGILRAVVAATEGRSRCGLMTTSSHPEMQQVFLAAGFRKRRAERPLALGAIRGRVDLDADTSGWMVSYEWGDNALRPPFDDAPQSLSTNRTALA